MQFAMVPMNLAIGGQPLDYVDTGTWSTKAIKEAQVLGKAVRIVASSADREFTYIPRAVPVDGQAAYLHVTSNNTIRGTQWRSFPVSGQVPLVSDMSSDIFSRVFDPTPFGLIHAGAQKNAGPAGVTLVIVREDLLTRVPASLPAMLKYTTYVVATPLQIASSVSALFNGGRFFQPRVVQSVRSPDGEVLQEIPPVATRSLHFTPEHVEFIRDALWGVVNGPGGTGSRAKIQGFDVGGKTGTSQVIQRREGRAEINLPEFQDHAWFVCFAPAPKPEITVVAFVEHGGGGGAAAAPVARKVMENYFLRKKSSPPPFQIALENTRPPGSP